MRFGNWRGVKPALAAAAALTALVFTAAQASANDFHTIPRLTPAVDLNTGGPYYAPPVPYGHYAGKNLGGKLSGKLHGLLGAHKMGCGSCGGAGCGECGGSKWGHGLGLGKHKGLGNLCGDPGCGECGGAPVSAVMSSPQGVPSPQGPVCGDPAGCGLFGKHKSGCGLFNKGCGSCGGAGCGSCGKPSLCGGCGGAGCGLCGKGAGLVKHLLGHDKIKWFVGPGGPVPLTPGYVPYINVTRSPRDYFAFPPMTP
ncbi:MAG: hypothetical protein U0835_04210 [Isosphaeraceae bacterium]